jgi:4-amino-4-deoxy-L-arabinose transferase-like glycosyltransferase
MSKFVIIHVMNKKLVILFVAAFIIRLIALDQSLWLDEATTAKVVQQFSLAEIITKFSPTDFHPPFYYLFMKLWTSMFGVSEIALRMPSVLFSLLAGWFVYLMGKALGVRRQALGKSSSYRLEPSSLVPEHVGFWAAAFFLFNPLIIYYSQEARMYMIVTFFFAASLYSFIQLLSWDYYKETKNSTDTIKKDFFKVSKIQYLWYFNICIFLSFLTFYGSVFFIVSMYLYLFWKKQFRLFFQLLPGFILALLVISPLLSHQLITSKEGLAAVKNWSLVLGKANVKNLALFPLKFAAGRISFYPKILYYALAGGWTVIVMFFVGRGMLSEKKFVIRNWKLGWVFSFLLLFPICLGLLFSFFTPLLQYFRFIYLIVPMSVLMALPCHPDGEKRPKDLVEKLTGNVVSTILLSCFTLWSLLYLFFPQFHREDWKHMVASYKALNTPYELYMTPSSYDPYGYYGGYEHITWVKNLQTLEKNSPQNQQVMVIPYASEIYGIDYRSLLEKYKYKRVSEHSFRGVTYEEWRR